MSIACGCADQEIHDEVVQAAKQNVGKGHFDFPALKPLVMPTAQAVWEEMLSLGEDGKYKKGPNWPS